MQVRDGVSQRQVVQLDRIEQRPHRPSHCEYFLPVPAGLPGVEVGRFCDVPEPPHDDAVTGEAGAPLQVDLSEMPRVDFHPEIVVAVAEGSAHRAALAGHPLGPVRRPPAISHGSFNHRRAGPTRGEGGTAVPYAVTRVTEEAWAAAAKHYDDDQLAALVSLIALINTYNRMNVITRQPGGDYQPGQWG
jgi:hypothetical protein